MSLLPIRTNRRRPLEHHFLTITQWVRCLAVGFFSLRSARLIRLAPVKSITSHMAAHESSEARGEAVDRRLTDPRNEGSGTSNCDYKGESLWGTPSGPQERLPGESLPDYYSRRGFPVSSGKSGRAITLSPAPRSSATERNDSADE
jgi:hypothetical protein